MPSHKTLRERVLIEMAKCANGNLEANVANANLETIFPDNDLSFNIVDQLIAKGWIKSPESLEADSGRYLVMTIEGIEEAEKMDQSSTTRFIARNPIISALALIIAQAILTNLVQKIF